MDDIFLDDPRQISAKAVSAKNKADRKLKKRRFREYFADLIIKSLICAVLIGIDFTLFAEAGSYSLFDNTQTLNAEAIIIYSAIAAVSFAILFLLSFSLFLQDLFTAIIAGLFVLAILTQFALFDRYSVLDSLFGQYFGAGISSLLTTSSHLIIAGTAGILFFLFLTYGRRSNQAYFLGTLIFIFGYIVSDAYFDPVSPQFKNIRANGDEFTHPNGRNIVFLALPQLASYNNLRELSQMPRASDDAKTAAAAMLGFYTRNNFTHYSAAYIDNPQKPFENLIRIFNPDSELSVEKLQLSDVLLKSYWDFSNLAAEKIYLKNNKIFDTFRNEDYNLHIYQTRGIELCRVNNAMLAAECTAKATPPINLENDKFSLTQKTILLTSGWLESTGLSGGLNPILKGLSFLGINKDIAPLKFSPRDLYVYNTPKILDMIAADIKSGSGNNAYFAVIDLPSDLYIYNGLCSIKPVSQWLSLKEDNNLLDKRQAYTAQVSCLYGKLENFIQQLQKEQKLDNTTIVVLGLSSPLPLFPGQPKDFYQEFKHQKQVALAVRLPQSTSPQTDSKICAASSILGNVILKQNECQELENIKISDNLKKNIRENNAKEQISEQERTNAVNRFKRWYQAWAGHNQVENLMLEPTIPLEKEQSEAQEVIIHDAPVAAVEELPEEKKLQSISEAAQQTEGSTEQTPENQDGTDTAEKKQPQPQISEPAQEDAAQTKPQKTEAESSLDKPQQLKEKAKTEQEQKKQTPELPSTTQSADVKIEVKVIENQKSHDVVPPFLLGEIQYRPAEEEKKE